MSSRTFSDHFCTPAPVYRPNQVPTCPFEEELLPTNSNFIYDMNRLSAEKIDNYANMLCYTIPSLNALVFFRWVVYRSTTVDDLGRVELDPVMDLERTMGNHGVENEDLYTITPCSYVESLQAYRRLMVSQAGHRILLQQLFQRRGIYEKYRLFIDSYEVTIGPTAYSTKVYDPPKAISRAFEHAQAVLPLTSRKHFRNISNDSIVSEKSEQSLCIGSNLHLVSSEELTPRPNRTRFA